MGSANNHLHNQGKALDYCNRGLTIQRETGDREGEARTLRRMETIEAKGTQT